MKNKKGGCAAAVIFLIEALPSGSPKAISSAALQAMPAKAGIGILAAFSSLLEKNG
jgi:hypothetical protein